MNRYSWPFIRYWLYKIWGEICFYLMLVLWTLDYSAVLLPEKVEKMNLGFLIRVLYQKKKKKKFFLSSWVWITKSLGYRWLGLFKSSFQYCWSRLFWGAVLFTFLSPLAKGASWVLLTNSSDVSIQLKIWKCLLRMKNKMD